MLEKQTILIGSRYQVKDEPTLKLKINNIPIVQVKETKLTGYNLGLEIVVLCISVYDCMCGGP